MRYPRDSDRQYATFVALDLTTGRVHECSCDPKLLGNQFSRSGLPPAISPVFFRSEVLQKYKKDSGKYRLGRGSIHCRDAWGLETYDVNESGQVFTYLKYLGNLPYQEQLYWKSCNEKPKGTISSRAWKTDFLGEWDTEYDPLESLTSFVQNLRHSGVSWWILREENLIENIHHPLTGSADDWADETHALDKLVVEGLVKKDLAERAITSGSELDKEWGSVRILRELLKQLKVDDEVIKEIIDPLKEVHHIRSKLSGHASGSEGKRIRTDIVRKYKSYSNHFRVLCERCDKAMRQIWEILEDGPTREKS